MLAKTESAKRSAALDRRFDVIALVETARGVVARRADRRPAERRRADVGRRGPRRVARRHVEPQAARALPRRRAHARSAVLLAAGAHGKAAIDAVHLDIDDVDGLAAEATDAAASGFAATACIHPSQVDGRPRGLPAGRRRRSRGRARVLAAAVGERGVFRFEGGWSTSRSCGTPVRCSPAPSAEPSRGQSAAPSRRMATIASATRPISSYGTGCACGKTTESFSARYGAISASSAGLEAGHGVEPDVLLPACEMQRVPAAEHDRGDAVADALLGLGIRSRGDRGRR